MTDMNEIGSAPSISTGRDANTARMKVSTASYQEMQIVRGTYFLGYSKRTGIPTGDTYDSVIKAGADKYLVLDNALIRTDFSGITGNGKFTVEIDGWIDISARNDWSYVVGSPLPAGVPLNAELINNFASSTIDLGVSATVNSGTYDYPLFFNEYHIESTFFSDSISNTESDFFKAQRQIMLAPNQEMLVRTVTAGDALGAATIETLFFFSEIDSANLPVVTNE